MEKNEREKKRKKCVERARAEGGERRKTQSWTERRGKKKWRGWFAKVNKKEGTRNEKSEKRMRAVDA